MASEKPFSYVRLMREIRDQINREISGMTFEEQQQWMREQRARQHSPTGAFPRDEQRVSG